MDVIIWFYVFLVSQDSSPWSIFLYILYYWNGNTSTIVSLFNHSKFSFFVNFVLSFWITLVMVWRISIDTVVRWWNSRLTNLWQLKPMTSDALSLGSAAAPTMVGGKKLRICQNDNLYLGKKIHCLRLVLKQKMVEF